MRRYLAFFALLCAALVLPARCWAQDEPIWQIGKSDNNYSEFAIADNYYNYSRRFIKGVEFQIGSSIAGKDWPYIQPGPMDGWAGAKPHRQKIVFNLDVSPAGIYALRIDLVNAHASHPPVLDIRVNGRSQIHHLKAGAPDAALTDPSAGIEQVITVYLTSRTLHTGKNTVQITSKSGSWILYDCISFSRCPNPPKSIENLILSPSYLFKKSNGKINQVLNASFDLREQCDVYAEVAAENGVGTGRIFRNVPAGRNNIELEVPAPAKPKKVHVSLLADKETAEADGLITPQKHWRIYILPSSHLDIGYTNIQDITMQRHRENLERAMDWCKQYPGFKWDLEGLVVADNYFSLGHRTDELASLIRAGRIGLMGFYANELTEICSGEELSRLIDYYDWTRRKFGGASECVMMNDVPTMTATMPMILAGHGIKYLSIGVNNDHTANMQDMYNTPYYWESPDGSRILMWKTQRYGQARELGMDESATLENVVQRVSTVLSQYDARNGYPFDAILIHGAYGDNHRNSETIASISEEWNRRYEYPKLVMSQGPEFFKYIEANFPQHLKTVTGDGGAWWEDGAASSAKETADVRRAKEKLVNAEKLTALCSPAFQHKMRNEFSLAWKAALLYDEHTWGAAGSIRAPDSEQTVKQWAVKQGFAIKATGLADQLLNAAIEEFCKEIKAGSDTTVVFNPSSWQRCEQALYPLSTTNYCSFATGPVPPMGYKVLKNHPVKYIEQVDQDNVLDNRYYTIKFDSGTGRITSIYDKDLKRELIDSGAYNANQYLYVTGGEGSSVMHNGRPQAELKIESPTDATLQKSIYDGCQVMEIDGPAPMDGRLSATIMLHDDTKRIDFINNLGKKDNLGKEAGYFAFPFAFKNPNIRIEIPAGVIRPDIDQIPGGCRDWFAVQQFMTISDDSAAVVLSPVDSPLITLQDINRGRWYDRLKIENGNVFAYVFNNYWYTNYKASQGGHLKFQFSMTSGKSFTDAQAKRFGEEVHSPMLVCPVMRKTAGNANNSHSFVNVQGDNIILQAMKPAKYADGTVIRLREMAGKSESVKVAVSGIKFKSAYLCNLAEDKLNPIPVNGGILKVPCRALGLTTVLLER